MDFENIMAREKTHGFAWEKYWAGGDPTRPDLQQTRRDPKNIIIIRKGLNIAPLI